MTKITISLKAIVAALLACGLYAALAAALAYRTFVSGKNCLACNKLIDMSWKIISLGTRDLVFGIGRRSLLLALKHFRTSVAPVQMHARGHAQAFPASEESWPRSMPA